MLEFEIKYEPITIDGNTVDKYNAYYYFNGEMINKTFHSYDGMINEAQPVQPGFTQKK
jgi:hypothetical protein